MRSLGAGLLPGSRSAWLGALLAALVGVVLFGRQLDAKPLPLTGTNSVDPASVIATAAKGQPFCVRDLYVPAHTKTVQVWLGLPQLRAGGSPPRFTGTLSGGSDTQRIDAVQRVGAGNWHDFPLRATTRRGVAQATLCLRASQRVDLAGANVMRLPGAPVSSIGRDPLRSGDVSVRFVGTHKTRLAARLGTALHRATRFNDWPGGSLLLWVAAAALLSCAYAAARIAATSGRVQRSPRRLAAYAALVALIASVCWALMTPAFFGPDESEHFAYVQHLAATGHRAAAAKQSPANPYSSDQLQLMEGLHHNSTILNGDSRPRWDGFFAEQYRAAATRQPQSASDGGGYTESASGHSPLYYFVDGLPYRVLHGHQSLPRVVFWSRMVSALMGAGVAALAVLIAALLLPGLPGAWWAAGLLVAGQPGFESVSASVDNDALVNLAAAVVVWLLVDGLVRGPRRWRMAALGVAVAVLPVAKVTGFGVWPAAAVGGALILWRWRSATTLIAPLALVAGAVLWVFALSPLLGGGHGALYNSHPADVTTAGSTVAVTTAGVGLLDHLDYALQMVAPFVHLTGDHWVQRLPVYDVYVVGGYGRYGWLNAGLRHVVTSIVGWTLLGAWLLAAAAALRWRRQWRRWLAPVAVLVAAVAGVFLFVAYAYTTVGPRMVPGEQGRYIFPAIAALAALLSGGVAALPARGRDAAIGFIATAMPLLGLLGWLAAVRDWFV